MSRVVSLLDVCGEVLCLEQFLCWMYVVRYCVSSSLSVGCMW